MRRSTILLFALLGGLAQLNATSLVQESCTLGEGFFTAPLENVGMTFNGGIRLLDNPTAEIILDGETIAVATNLEVSNYTSEKRTQGTLSMTFDKMLLMTGHDFTLKLRANSVASESDASITNDDITVQFFVPADTGECRFDYEQGATIASAHNMWVYWQVETEPARTPEWELYRKNVLVRKYPAKITWDWNLGQAYADFGEEIKFENGVNYHITLPEGSAHAMLRDDIVNSEATLNFVGGSTDIADALMFSDCSLYKGYAAATLGEVTFDYPGEIALTGSPAVELWLGDGSRMVKSVTPTLESAEGGSVLHADFGGEPLDASEGYCVVIPESCVVTKSGDIVVNARNEVRISESGVAALNVDSLPDVRIENGVVTVAHCGSAILYSIDGRLQSCAIPMDGTAEFRVPKGTYILTANGKSRKIMVM
jgi:hypothetical protein